jgi:hypothetical protein
MKIRNILLNPDVNGSGGGAPAGAGAGSGGQAPVFDPQKFRDEIASSNRQMFEQFSGSMQNTMKTMLEAFRQDPGNAGTDSSAGNPGNAGTGVTPKQLEPYMAEMEALGLEENQANALINFVTKVLGSKVPQFEQQILGKVDENNNNRSQQQQMNMRVAQQYPDAMVPGSPLRSAAQDLFSRLSEAERKHPAAMANCVREAAAELGIAPVSKEQFQQHQSQNPTGGASAGGQHDKGKPDQVELDFAKAFGVSQDKYEEKLRIVRMGQKR